MIILLTVCEVYTVYKEGYILLTVTVTYIPATWNEGQLHDFFYFELFCKTAC